MKDVRRLLREILPYSGTAIWVVLLSLGSVAMTLLNPWIYRAIVNLLTQYGGNPSPEAWAHLWQYVGLSLTVVLVGQGFDAFQRYFDQMLWIKIYMGVTRKTFAHLIYLPLDFFEGKAVGTIGERMTGGVRDIAHISSSILVDFLPVIIRFVAASVIMLLFDLRLGLIFVAGVPVFVVVMLHRGKLLSKSQEKIRTIWEKQGRAIYHAIGNVRLIKLFGQGRYENDKLGRLTEHLTVLTRRQEVMLQSWGIVRNMVSQLSYVAVLAYGGYLVFSGGYKVGDLVLFITYISAVFQPLYQLFGIYDLYVRGMRAAVRLFKIIDIPSELNRQTSDELNVKDGSIEFKNVVFGYRRKRLKGETGEVFKRLNLKIKSKEVVALVGPSGVGKSTLVKLLTRFIEPTKGSVLIDGQDIKKVTYDSLRQNIAVVMQDSMTFADTIGRNIRVGRARATDKEVMEAAKVANIDKFIEKLSRKLRTFIGERGVKLSGGEQQRVAIARAVLKDAPILVLDEATSALDSENEQMIQEALWKLIEGRTTIIIAHRLSTVKRADRIVVFENGKITEQGSHKELMKRSGYYRRLFTLQGAMLEK